MESRAELAILVLALSVAAFALPAPPVAQVHRAHVPAVSIERPARTPLPFTSGVSVAMNASQVGTSVSSRSCSLAGVLAGSGLFVFMGWQNASITPSSVSDGTDTFIELEYQTNTPGGTSSAIAVYATQNTSDHSANVKGGSYTITATLSSASPDFSLYCLEVAGYGASGRIYVDSYSRSPGTGNAATYTPQVDPFRPSPDGMILLPVVQSGATFTGAPTGTFLAGLTGGAGTSLGVSYGLVGSTIAFQTPVGISWSAAKAFAGPWFEVDAIPAILTTFPGTTAPSLGGSVNIYQPDFLYEPLGAHTSNASVVFSFVPAGTTLVVAVLTLPGFSGSSAYAGITITDSEGNTYTKIGRAQSGNSFSSSSAVEDVYATNASAPPSGAIVVKVVVQQFSASSPFELWFADIVSNGRVIWGVPGLGGGNTGTAGGHASVTNATLPVGTWITLGAGGLVSAAASAPITFTATGSHVAAQNTPVQDTNNLPNFYQLNTTETGASDTTGAAWSPSSSSDSWAFLDEPFGAKAPVRPILGLCATPPVKPGVITPQLSDPAVLTTMNAASRNLHLNAYVETITSRQCLTTFWVTAINETYWANVTPMAKLTSELAGLSGGSVSVLVNDTWINSTGKCQAFYCFPNQTLCDSQRIVSQLPSYRLLADPCSDVGIRYAGPLPLGGKGEYVNVTVTRVYQFLVTVGSYWLYPVALRASTALNMTLVSPTMLNATFGYGGSVSKNNATSFLSMATLVVPYATGTWDPSETQVRYYSNATNLVTNFDQTLVDVIVSFQNVSKIQNLTVALFGTPGGTFGSGNQTVPLTITLALLNATSLPGGLTEETATWTNHYAGVFTGEIICTGPWVITAADTNATVDGSPVASTYTTASVDVLTGQVNASNGTTLTVSVTFVVVSTFSATRPFLYLGNVAIDWIALIAAATLVAGVSAYALRRHRGESQALTLGTGVGVLGIAFILCLLI